jgi:uncharacterized protein YndB with AHSA1/START domain
MRIATTIHIDRPPEQVFAFVTTPGNWPRWHPSSLRVSGEVDHPLEVGEQVAEEFSVGGVSGTAVWTGRESQPPSRFVLDGGEENRIGATLTYTLTPQEGGTDFHREFLFTWVPPLPDHVLAEFHRQVEAESAEALRRLKAVPEGPADGGPARQFEGRGPAS